MDKKKLAYLKDLCKRATPAPWTGTVNYPFYAQLDKPAPSESKHEGSPRGATLWRIADVEFVVSARQEMANLISYIEELEKKVNGS
jgi:hypothetical protein